LIIIIIVCIFSALLQHGHRPRCIKTVIKTKSTTKKYQQTLWAAVEKSKSFQLFSELLFEIRIQKCMVQEHSYNIASTPFTAGFRAS